MSTKRNLQVIPLGAAVPGPWHVVRSEEGNTVGGVDYEQIRDTSHYAGHRVAKIGDWNGRRHNPRSKRTRATAKIVAAAPAFVKLLREIRDTCPGVHMTSQRTGVTYASMIEVTLKLAGLDK